MVASATLRLYEFELPLQSLDVRAHTTEFTLDCEHVADGNCPVEQFQQALLSASLAPEAGRKVDGLSRNVPLTEALSQGLPQPFDAIERVEESVAGDADYGRAVLRVGPPGGGDVLDKAPNRLDQPAKLDGGRVNVAHLKIN